MTDSNRQCIKCLTELAREEACYGLHPACFTAWFKVPSTSNFVSLTRRSVQSNQTAQTSPQNISFFHGKFKKYSAELDGHSYILKMREIDAPELPEVEYTCNQIAELFGIPVAAHFLIDFEGERVFVTRNFIKKSALSDLQHIYHFRPDDQHTCEKLISVITEQAKRPYDVGVFVDTLLFDALIGNHDRHGRNLAFIVTSGKSSLSPIYDNVSYLGLEKGTMLNADFNPLGKIATISTAEPSMKDYVLELKRLGYEENVAAFWDKLKLNQIETIINNGLCSELMKKAICKLVRKRAKELEDEIKN